jgi:hypothetical protein
MGEGLVQEEGDVLVGLPRCCVGWTQWMAKTREGWLRVIKVESAVGQGIDFVRKRIGHVCEYEERSYDCDLEGSAYHPGVCCRHPKGMRKRSTKQGEDLAKA